MADVGGEANKVSGFKVTHTEHTIFGNLQAADTVVIIFLPLPSLGSGVVQGTSVN